MHKSFPFQCIFSTSLPTFRKGVHCTKALHPLTRAVRAVQCLVRFSTLYAIRTMVGKVDLAAHLNTMLLQPKICERGGSPSNLRLRSFLPMKI